MRNTIISLLTFLCLSVTAGAQPRSEILLREGWRFHQGGIEGAADTVFVYTSYPSAELSVNGVSQGVRCGSALCIP